MGDVTRMAAYHGRRDIAGRRGISAAVARIFAFARLDRVIPLSGSLDEP